MHFVPLPSPRPVLNPTQWLHSVMFAIKKPAGLASSHSTLQSLGNWYSQCHQSSCNRPAPSTSARRGRRREYATISSETPDPSREDLQWPKHSPNHLPSPYEIFNLKRNDPYSKRRFYELVKLYHPDRNPHESEHDNPCHCSRSVMLERYRLIITAHTILSDPVKRSAYDQFGYGWTIHHGANSESYNTGKWKWTTEHRWRDKDGSVKWSTDMDPMYNATWEDWERWYERMKYGPRVRSPWSPNFFSRRGPQRTVYFNNYTFVSLVFLLAALGGVGQATRAQSWSQTRLDRVNAVNLETSESLTKAREGTRSNYMSGESRDRRIKRFVAEKEDYREGEFDGRALRRDDDGLCSSGAVKDKDEPRFWQKPPER